MFKKLREKIIIVLLKKHFKKIIKKISPHIKRYLREELLPQLKEKCQATPNEWDDILINVLLDILE